MMGKRVTLMLYGGPRDGDVRKIDLGHIAEGVVIDIPVALEQVTHVYRSREPWKRGTRVIRLDHVQAIGLIE